MKKEKINYTLTDWRYSSSFYEDEKGIKHKKEQTYELNIFCENRNLFINYLIKKQDVKNFKSFSRIIETIFKCVNEFN